MDHVAHLVVVVGGGSGIEQLCCLSRDLQVGVAQFRIQNEAEQFDQY
jgi:hypothetical protein